MRFFRHVVILHNEPHAKYFTPSISHAGRAEDSLARVDTGS
jgi:hypothetical protein